MSALRVRPNSEPERGRREIITCDCICYLKPQYRHFEKRLQSFKDWPVGIKQRPFELAKAGFYYTGRGDHLICYSCGGGVGKWEENDEPWTEHARWYPNCQFIQSSKSSRETCEVQQTSLPATAESAITEYDEEKKNNKTLIKYINYLVTN